jgi:hypothetical protein
MFKINKTKVGSLDIREKFKGKTYVEKIRAKTEKF